MEINDRSRITRAPHVVLTRAGDEGVLVDEQGGGVHVVNATAARVWELCNDEPTLDELVDAMSREYQVDATEARADLESVLTSFRDLELVRLAPPA